MLNGFYGVRDRLEELGEIVVREKDFWGYSQHRTIALRSAEVSKLTSDELNIVNRVIRQSEDMSAAQISSASHDFIGWQIVDIGEEIPVMSHFLGESMAHVDTVLFPPRTTSWVRTLMHRVGRWFFIRKVRSRKGVRVMSAQPKRVP